MSKKEYQLIRSRRKTLAICIDAEGNVTVRAPLRMAQWKIDSFVSEKQSWIDHHAEKQRRIASQKRTIRLAPDEVAAAKRRAKEDLTERIRRFEPLLGVKCSAVKINSAKSRWGSCTSKGTINFPYRLWFAPEPLRDYVVVHELAHLIEMNHSEHFWKQVERVLPDYRQRRYLLKQFQQQVSITEGIETK